MKQIITIQVGQSGNQIGNAIWNQMMDDCGDKLDQKFFREGIPRTVLVDSEENTLDKISGNKNLQYYDPNNFIYGKNGKCLTFASGYYGQNDLFDEIVERVRKEHEQCDGVQAVQLIHSINGGTGSGMGAKLVYYTSDHFCDCSKINISIYPSKHENSVIYPYNSLLGLMHLNYNYNMGFYFDNDSLQQMTENMFIYDQNYETYNQLLGFAMDGIYKSFRHNSYSNTNFYKIQTNITPFPRLHCYTISLAPLFSYINTPSLLQVSKEIYSKRNQTFSMSLSSGVFLAQQIMIYGDTDVFSVQQEFKQAISSDDIQFVKWVADPITYIICPNKQKQCELMAFSINHHTGIGIKLNQLKQQFKTLFQKRAYLHLFMQEGLDELELQEAESACGDVISEYCCYNDQTDTTDE
ncbi:unnamed protein product [Paramecium sonneborni]|uniref:Tubulin/FtsZ GTPase domain-containing protein n=1 Tax=Paramecium sonneborni TaxID=65129 RepID=A0A8S1Q8C7_9CILI|nr:unnamed protein product [Paramecium sonneborni]